LRPENEGARIWQSENAAKSPWVFFFFERTAKALPQFLLDDKKKKTLQTKTGSKTKTKPFYN
jgi:hypothetical protein